MGLRRVGVGRVGGTVGRVLEDGWSGEGVGGWLEWGGC